MTGFVQQGMQRGVVAGVNIGADDAGFAFAPVAAGNRLLCADPMQVQAETMQQTTWVVPADVGQAQNILIVGSGGGGHCHRLKGWSASVVGRCARAHPMKSRTLAVSVALGQ